MDKVFKDIVFSFISKTVWFSAMMNIFYKKKDIDTVFIILHENNFKMSASKSVFDVTSVNLLGF